MHCAYTYLLVSCLSVWNCEINIQYMTEIGCYMKSTLNRLASFRKSGHLNDNNFEIQYYSVRSWSYSIHIWRKSGENMVLWLFFIRSVTIFQYVFLRFLYWTTGWFLGNEILTTELQGSELCKTTSILVLKLELFAV